MTDVEQSVSSDTTFLAAAAEFADALFVILDAKGYILAVNAQGRAVAQKPIRAHTRFWQAFSRDVDRHRVQRAVLNLVATGHPIEVVSQLDGPRHLQWRLCRHLVGDNVLIIAVGIDDTKEWRNNGRLRARLEALLALTDEMPDPIFIKDDKGRWIQINEAARELFDMKSIDYHGKTEEDLAQIMMFYRGALKVCAITDQEAWRKRSAVRNEEYVHKPDGTVRVLETFKVPLFHPDGKPKCLVVLGHDITEREQGELALAARDRQLRGILESTQDAILVTDNGGRLLFLNHPMEQLLGCTAGKSLAEQMSKAESWKVTMPGGAVTTLGNLCGSYVCHLKTAITGAELEIPDPAGGPAEVFSISLAPLTPHGTGAVLNARNITAVAELESMKTDFLRTVAHELRTPLTALQTGLDRCQRRLDHGETIRPDIVGRMNAQAQRLTEIVNALVEVTLLDTGDLSTALRVVDVSQLVGDAVNVCQANARQRKIVVQGTDQAHYTLSDPTCVEHVIKHLIDNAIKYSTDEIRVSVVENTSNVEVAVVDFGPGIPHRHWQRLFTRMPSIAERTNSRQGLGVNLYICRRLAEALGGTIQVSSEPAHGTCFRFSLPIWAVGN